MEVTSCMRRSGGGVVCIVTVVLTDPPTWGDSLQDIDGRHPAEQTPGGGDRDCAGLHQLLLRQHYNSVLSSREQCKRAEDIQTLLGPGPAECHRSTFVFEINVCLLA